MDHFPDTLREWRKTRRFSQLDLALEADVSARHISFLETGRARPSADMIDRLGDALELPLAARNQMLTSAGYAARFQTRDWQDSQMAPIRAAVDHMLTSHAPYPAMAVNRLWQVQALNTPAQLLFAPLGLGVGGSLLDLVMSDVLPNVIENWPEVAHHSAHRLRVESAAQGGIPELDAAAQHLSQVPLPDSPPVGPVIPATYRLGDMRLSLFATISQFGTPHDLALEDMKIEHYFPADEATAQILRAMVT